MRLFLMLLRRELWEHPALYVAPMVVGVFVLLTVLVGLAQGVGAGAGLKIVIDGVGALGDLERATGLALALSVLGPLFFIVLVAVAFFYLLDALYAERRERTVLFFKSLPITDTATVASKAATAMLVAPAVTVGILILTQICALLMMSVFVVIGGENPWRLLWQPLPLLETWLLLIYGGLAVSIWYAPFVGWFLVVSAWARRAVFLWAISPFLAGQLELLVRERSLLFELVSARAAGFLTVAFDQRGMSWLAGLGEDDGSLAVSLSGVRILKLADPLGFLSSRQVWMGLVVGAAFAIGAVYLRRFRDDS